MSRLDTVPTSVLLAVIVGCVAVLAGFGIGFWYAARNMPLARFTVLYIIACLVSSAIGQAAARRTQR